MKCLLIPTDEAHPSGRQLLRCKRAGCQGKMLANPEGHNLNPPACHGWPLITEAREWAEGLAAVFGMRYARKLYKQALWRLRGSPIDDLPPGVPHPNVLPKPVPVGGLGKVPAEGPGTELAAMLTALGVSPTKSCGCAAVRDEMNRLGPDGCRRERQRFIDHLKAAYDETDLPAKARAGLAALWQGTPVTLAGLVDEAVRRAEEKTVSCET